MTDELQALADRVEALAGPCRETDADIALTLKIPDWRAQKPWKQTNGWAKANCARDAWSIFFHDGMGGSPAIPAFTASLDAAMTLVPEPGKWSITSGHGDDWQASVWGLAIKPMEWHSAATPALALTAAALRSIAAGQP